MRNPFSKSDTKKPDMTFNEKLIIRSFACGNKGLRDRAIEIHHKYIPILGARGESLEQTFMSEIDNPCPDLNLREHYRNHLIAAGFDTMQPMNEIDVLESICKNTNRWGLYINIFVPDEVPIGKSIDEILKAAFFLNPEDHGQIIADGHGWFFFDTQEEMEAAYWTCVGDDGPTEVNPYDGPVRVYALTCDTLGVLMNENT